MKCNCQEEASKQLRSKVVCFALSIKTKNSSTLEDYFISAEKKSILEYRFWGVDMPGQILALFLLIKQ